MKKTDAEQGVSDTSEPRPAADCEACLPPATAVDQFIIDRPLSYGGFSIVYLAHDRDTGLPVVIKEYMPRRLARRTEAHRVSPREGVRTELFLRGRRLFFQEASALAQVSHPNIVAVITFFRAFDTVYMVMPFEHGQNLQRHIKSHESPLAEDFLRTMFMPLLDGLKVLHEHRLLHLDIKPSNIHLCDDGRALLLDFGAVHYTYQSRARQVGRVTSGGFSPIEQYQPEGYVGPWTDIYAVGATLRACLEGRPPPDARRRYDQECMKPASQAFRRQASRELLQAIDWAMEIDPLARPQRVDDLIEALQEPSSTPAQRPSMLGRLSENLPWGRH